MTEKDLRKVLPGCDVGEIVRKAAAELLELGEKHGREREQRALLHSYTSRPSLEVEVVQLRSSPPLWRMTTCQALTETSGRVSVEEAHREHLEPEMRIKARNALLTSGMFDEPGVTLEEKQAKARTLAASMQIHEVGLVRLADSQRFKGEWR